MPGLSMELSPPETRRSTSPRRSHRSPAEEDGPSDGEWHPGAARGVRRRQRNRDAARKSRQKATERADLLHQELQRLERDNASLQKDISVLQKDKDYYCTVLERHAPHCRLRPTDIIDACSAPSPVTSPVPTSPPVFAHVPSLKAPAPVTSPVPADVLSLTVPAPVTSPVPTCVPTLTSPAPVTSPAPPSPPVPTRVPTLTVPAPVTSPVPPSPPVPTLVPCLNVPAPATSDFQTHPVDSNIISSDVSTSDCFVPPPLIQTSHLVSTPVPSPCPSSISDLSLHVLSETVPVSPCSTSDLGLLPPPPLSISVPTHMYNSVPPPCCLSQMSHRVHRSSFSSFLYSLPTQTSKTVPVSLQMSHSGAIASTSSQGRHLSHQNVPVPDLSHQNVPAPNLSHQNVPAQDLSLTSLTSPSPSCLFVHTPVPTNNASPIHASAPPPHALAPPPNPTDDLLTLLSDTALLPDLDTDITLRQYFNDFDFYFETL